MNQNLFKLKLVVVPGFLLVVALNQMYRANYELLTPWKGGGFGMFSSTDAPDSRLVLIYLVTENERIRVNCPRELSREFLGLRSYPRQKELNSFTNQLARFKWRDYGVIAGYIKKEFDEEDGAQNDTSIDDQWQAALNPPEKTAIESVRFVSIEAERFKSLPNGKLLEFNSVQVEVWRFDYEKNEVELKKLIESDSRDGINESK